MTKYNEYKDSSIPWIGHIPSHWTVLRGKNVLTLLERPIRDTDEVITCFRDGEVTLRKNRREEGFTFSLQEIGYQGIEPGDLVVHGMDGFAGAIGVSDSRGKATPVLNVMDSSHNKRYLMYYLRMASYKDVFMALSTGIRVRSCDLRWNKLSIFPFVLPSRAEQDQIVKYIDDRLLQIDNIISEVKVSLEEYKTYKTSVIYEAVTKGLDANVKMKNSNISWLGKIPTTWSIPSVRNFFNINRGKVIAKTEISLDYEEGLYPIFSSQTKNNGCMGYIDTYDFEEESLTWTTDGANAGTVFYRNGKFNCTNVCGILTLKNKGQLWMPFCTYSIGLSAHNCRRADINGYKIMSNEMASIKFALPPTIEEQKQIADYLDEKCKSIDAIISEKEKLLTELELYKKSLVFEVVTGKRKVV